MWFRKKVVIIPVLVALVVVGCITGIALAQDESDTPQDTLLAKVATILGIDQTELENAFSQAQQEMRDEALSNYLADMVEQGKITQEEADQYKSWWSSRPDALDKLGPGFGLGGCGRGFHHGGGPGMMPDLFAPSTESTQ